MGVDAQAAKLVKKKLGEKKMTAEKLAYEIGISKGFLSDFLTGKKGISLKTLKKIADGLGVSLKSITPS